MLKIRVIFFSEHHLSKGHKQESFSFFQRSGGGSIADTHRKFATSCKDQRRSLRTDNG